MRHSNYFGIRICWIFSTIAAIYSEEAESDRHCSLPTNWIGTWVTSYHEPGLISDLVTLSIKTRTFGDKGHCVNTEADKFDENVKSFTFHNKDNACYKHLLITQRHENVLEYRENSQCHDDAETARDEFGQDLDGDLHNFIYRLEALPILCPFKDAQYTFTYKKDGGSECDDPVSNSYACATSSKLAFDFQSCPTVAKSESIRKDLTCIASWKEGNHEYVVGEISVKAHKEIYYRCLSYQNVSTITNGVAQIAYIISLSETPSCSGVNDGYQVLKLRKVDEHNTTNCQLPAWLINTAPWTSLNGSLVMSVKNDSGTFEVQNYEEMNQVEYLLKCTVAEIYSENYYVITAKKISDCDRIPTCLHVYRRSACIIQMEMFKLDENNELCSEYNRNYLKTLTFVKGDSIHHKEDVSDSDTSTAGLDLVPCPFHGKYSVNTLKKNDTHIWKCPEGWFNTLVIGCTNSENGCGQNSSIQFFSSCRDTPEPIAEFNCIATWEESDITFVVVRDVTTSGDDAVVNRCVLIQNTSLGIIVGVNNYLCQKSYKESAVDEWNFNATLLNESSSETFLASSSLPKVWTQSLAVLLLIACVVFPEYHVAFTFQILTTEL